MADSPAEAQLTDPDTSAVPQDDTGADVPAPRAKVSPGVVVGAGLGIALLIAAVVTGIVLNSAEQSGDSDNSTAEATGPVLLVPVDAPLASSAECANLVKNLPAALPNSGGKLARRTLAAPAPSASAAWGSGDDPVVLRCGVEQPPEFTATSELLGVDGVQWLQINGQDGDATWYAVDRGATVALTLPGGLGTGPIQEVSATVASTMPAQPIHPAGG